METLEKSIVKEAKVGDWAIVEKTYKPKENRYDNGSQEELAKNGHVVYVSSSQMDYYTGNRDLYYVKLSTHEGDRNICFFGNKHFRVVTGNELKALQEKLAKYNEEVKAKEYESIQAFVEGRLTKRVPIVRRTFNHADLQAYDTCFNFIQIGQWNKEANTIPSGDVHFKETCSSEMKGIKNQDFALFIPKMWCDYYGYNHLDIRKWLEFIKESDIGLTYHFDKNPMPLSKEFGRTEEKYKGVEKTDPYTHAVGEAITVLPKGADPMFYRIIVEGAKADRWRTYMRFLVLRYLYNAHYWEIPGVAMQIKMKLGEKVTNWQALLMAHMKEPYYDYHCLLPNYTNKGAKGDQCQSPDITQTIEEVLQRCNQYGNGMIKSFKHYQNNLDTKTVKDFFDKKNYEGLLNYLTEHKNKEK